MLVTIKKTGKYVLDLFERVDRVGTTRRVDRLIGLDVVDQLNR